MINRLVSAIRDGVFQLRGTVKVNTSTKWNLARCINTTDLFKVKKLLASLQNKRFCIFMYLSVSILCHHFKYLLKKILLKKMARKNASRLDSSDRLSPHKDLFLPVCALHSVKIHVQQEVWPSVPLFSIFTEEVTTVSTCSQESLSETQNE